jgi:hypothetical protein
MLGSTKTPLNTRLVILVTASMRSRLGDVADRKKASLGEIVRDFLETGLTKFEKTKPRKPFYMTVSKAAPTDRSAVETAPDAAEPRFDFENLLRAAAKEKT